ncbi:unnamed protein product [Rotaria sordida]|uniref:Uncharacterized protein n=1 Tax=Rotaria sordida TaxID=392033 RepID=A0A815SSI1_9BILA|nr:unnamed protein product [Rotaria sordida]
MQIISLSSACADESTDEDEQTSQVRLSIKGQKQLADKRVKRRTTFKRIQRSAKMEIIKYSFKSTKLCFLFVCETTKCEEYRIIFNYGDDLRQDHLTTYYFDESNVAEGSIDIDSGVREVNVYVDQGAHEIHANANQSVNSRRPYHFIIPRNWTSRKV